MGDIHLLAVGPKVVRDRKTLVSLYGRLDDDVGVIEDDPVLRTINPPILCGSIPHLSQLIVHLIGEHFT